MKIFIDFDDVIFNTKQFREDLKDVFLSFGVSKELYEETYYDTEYRGLVKSHDPIRQISRIKKSADVNEENLKRAMKDFLGKAGEYVFPDFAPLVESFGAENFYVVSYGDLRFQNEKIKASRIDRLINNIFVAEELKTAIVKKIIEEKNIPSDEDKLFIDDRVEHLDDMEEKFPEITTIWMRRLEGRWGDAGNGKAYDFEAKNLSEVGEIINKIAS